jgi:hypothetical protein
VSTAISPSRLNSTTGLMRVAELVSAALLMLLSSPDSVRLSKGVS